jgi:prepilin-type N-terminal cleavage/methylation domain-containing protein
VKPKPCAPRSRASGFTLIELLVVLAIVSIAMGLGIPAIRNFVLRSQTEGFARDLSALMQRTRLESIKKNRNGAVFLDFGARQAVAFVDSDRDGAFDPTGTDYVLGRLPLPANLAFKDPVGNTGVDSIDGFTPVGAENWAVFQPDGSVANQGAFRIGDVRDNFLEVRVAPAATARVTLHKWQNGKWLGTVDPSQPGYEPWEWN